MIYSLQNKKVMKIFYDLQKVNIKTFNCTHFIDFKNVLYYILYHMIFCYYIIHSRIGVSGETMVIGVQPL